MGNKSDIPVSEQPILPEMVVACLQNLAAYEHRSDDGSEIVTGPSEWAMRFLSRVLRERPQAMIDALRMQTGSDHTQDEQGAMCAARKLVIETSVMSGNKAVFLNRFEVLELLEKREPRLFIAIPTSARGKSAWWKKARLDFLDQQRGGAMSAAYIKFTKKRDSSIRNG